MVHHHRAAQQQQLKLLEHQHTAAYADCCGVGSTKRCISKRTLFLRFIGIFSIISSALVFAPRFLSPDYFEDNLQTPSVHPLCASMSNHSICCDRTAVRTDVCFMRGDVRTHSASNSLLLHLPRNSTASMEEQLIRPYTRKWEAGTMATIDELHLKTINGSVQGCDVVHDVPAVVFSTGGYTGNVYHEFNDGILPLYITAGHFNKEVVLVLLEYHDWWITKYGDILSQLSDYTPIDFTNDKRTHCFKEAIVGLRIHDELTIDAAKMPNNRTIRDFRNLLDEAYKPRIRAIEQEEAQANTNRKSPTRSPRKPKLVIVARNGSRSIENEVELVKSAEEVGFAVEVLRPERTTELAKIYRALNSSDAMIGVHGAAMTHFLFMRPGTVFIQVVPLGTDWAAASYYGDPAARMGLRYMEYKIEAKESSLSREYDKEDPVLRDPERVNARGWEITKKVYLDGQNVRLDLKRFKKHLIRAHHCLVKPKIRKTGSLSH
ncbi:hypothetical protein J5N97_009200 [Dioscorea zingiberensis]|uniref:Glycosyltransferase 61 catalytic domain-containing protein n=1 Tax=Dioscorea zingiberensis TaxID=325984 RepID=A0A9D5CVY0_9LILI|nr:hypothetical protein J5N97_009200 [Dioscorea zingiberensis]